MAVYCTSRMFALECCGIVELGNFSADYYSGHDVRTILEHVQDLGRNKALMASTALQPEVVKELKKWGFKRIKGFRNPNSRNIVTVWFRKPGGK